MNRTFILDCTLRDGGLGFEDAAKYADDTPFFSETDRTDIAQKLSEAKLDIIELGSIEKTEEDKRRFAIYQNVEEVSSIMPSQDNPEQLFVALYRGPDTPLGEIPKWHKGLCKGLRVILRYSELQKSLDFCTALAQKGYKVFVQPMLTMRYTEQELQMVLDAANEMGAFAVYFVDSYGYMESDDIKRLFDRYNKTVRKEIKIGFHAHNNKNLAFSNAMTFLEQNTEHDLILDSCIMGVGQGAGNLQTEIIADHLNTAGGKEYNYAEILDACEIVGQHWTNNAWGYSVTNFIPTRHHAAYKYAMAMRNTYHMSYREIDAVLAKMSYDMRQRYTAENLEKALKN